MKKIFHFTVIVMIGLTLFSGCAKKSSSSSPAYNMKATLGTTAYNAPNCLAVATGGQMVIEGLGGASTAPTFPYVAIIMVGWTGTKTSYDLGTGAGSYGQYLESSSSIKISQTGTITITDVTSTSVSGTFSFTCTDGTTVTNGMFNAKKM